MFAICLFTAITVITPNDQPKHNITGELTVKKCKKAKIGYILMRVVFVDSSLFNAIAVLRNVNSVQTDIAMLHV